MGEQNYEEYMRRVLGYSPQESNIYENYNYRDSYATTYDRNEYANHLTEEQAEALYPEIYHLINPMVCQMCNANTEPITKELLERMTDEICSRLGENETVVNVRIETPKEANRENIEKAKNTETRRERPISKLEEIRNNRSYREMRISGENRVESTRREDSTRAKIGSNETKIKGENVENNRSSKGLENRQSSSNLENRETRRPNQSLRDLIKILILKQLLGGGNRPPVRPPHPPYPGGPGMMPPPRPPYPGGRPPMGGGTNNPPMRPRDYENYLIF